MTALLARCGAALRGLTGWRRATCAFAAGGISALGFAPLNFIPALLLAFTVLLLLFDGADKSRRPVRAGFACGWAFAFGQYLIGWHWIGYAFMVDPSAHLWQMPFALVILTGGLALWTGLACGLARYFWQDGPARLFVFAALYAAAEWVRGHALTGFPWNLQAYGWAASLAILQSTAVIGAYGLSFLTILLGASLGEFFTGARLTLKRLAVPLCLMLMFGLLWGLGAARLATTPTTTVPGVHLRLVQPNIPQAEKDQRRYLARNWGRLLDLSWQRRGAEPSIIIWPEAAPPFFLARAPFALDEITLLTGDNRVLMTGSQRVEALTDKVSYHNSFYIFGPGGAALAVYDKFHLVPFGEYVPFARWLNRIGITKLTEGEEGFDSGDGPHTYAVPGAPPVGPLICYEIIFPAAVTDPHAVRPQWFVNVTDDSWFGPWAGPHQHLLIARVRAIEEAIPVARAAYTGISAIIDPLGRVTAQLGIAKLGVVDGPLPSALPQTLYSRFGDLFFLLLLLASAGLAWALGRK